MSILVVNYMYIHVQAFVGVVHIPGTLFFLLFQYLTLFVEKLFCRPHLSAVTSNDVTAYYCLATQYHCHCRIPLSILSLSHYS